ncbi:hypothetical protein T492DRAFT_1025991 [Pavlovales sp. CCMP2436]|nr:hypothetical protein T492DRAFT_1025991 [Pavlovales sp. CCMP2436]
MAPLATIPVRGGRCVNRYVDRTLQSDVAALGVDALQWAQASSALTTPLARLFFDNYIFVAAALFGSAISIAAAVLLRIYGLLVSLPLVWLIFYASVIWQETKSLPKRMHPVIDELNARIFADKGLAISYRRTGSQWLCFNNVFEISAANFTV